MFVFVLERLITIASSYCEWDSVQTLTTSATPPSNVAKEVGEWPRSIVRSVCLKTAAGLAASPNFDSSAIPMAIQAGKPIPTIDSTLRLCMHVIGGRSKWYARDDTKDAAST